MDTAECRVAEEKWLSLLACPRCHGRLQRHQGLRCAACGATYPLLAGRPVFLEDPSQARVMPVEHLSNAIPDEVVEWIRSLQGRVLNLGAGGTRFRLDNCLELEHVLFRHTDVVADAHHLPFRDQAFDAVVTFNTFEHLADPVRAASEIHRVLKPGGRLVLHTAFLQPVHEPPYHFYNTTEYGLRRWFADFEIQGLSVSPNFNPGYVFAWLASEAMAFVEASLGPEAAETVARTPLREWCGMWRDASQRQHPALRLLGQLPQEYQKRISAGFQLEAVKPAAQVRRANTALLRRIGQRGKRLARGLLAWIRRLAPTRRQPDPAESAPS
jgi:SAM-dependent methyltransferase